MTRNPAEAIGMISGNRPSSSTLIIDVWVKAMPVACQKLLWQQHLVGLRCLDSTSKQILVICLPQLEVDINKDGNLCDKWITGTMSDAAGKMQPVKVSVNLVFHDFNKLAQLYTDFPNNMKRKLIKKIPSNGTVIPLYRDSPLHMVSLPRQSWYCMSMNCSQAKYPTRIS
eukprot:12804050-Ditylum_brightwellii.AAC.1